MVCVRFNNSAFIIDVVTVFSLFTFEIINPLKRCMIYSCELFRVFMLSSKEVFIAIFNIFPSQN